MDAAPTSAPIAFEEQMLQIARDYVSWGRVDDEMRWAPGLCRLRSRASPAEHVDDPTTHGQKLYSVFAKNWAQYPNGPHDGQAVVKQSWTVEVGDHARRLVESDRDVSGAGTSTPITSIPTRRDRTADVFHAGELAGLYIMFKLDPSTPETDEGWVYATVTPAGQVTSAGRVASCMGCHEPDATHERLYGVPKSAF